MPSVIAHSVTEDSDDIVEYPDVTLEAVNVKNTVL